MNETEDLRGGLTHRTTTDPYRAEKRTRKANAQPAGGGGGGGGGGWKEMNDKMAAQRAKLQSKAIGGADWIAQKKLEGDIDGGMNAEKIAGAGTSIFDPVLCELAYRWFCPPKGIVVDPFAGGSVRGIVASSLGRQYVGVDLRAEQVSANQAQAKQICKKPMPRWITGDSTEIAKLASGFDADFIFSCPPYADLEVYSDDPRDLSTMDYADFRKSYAEIIRASCSLLKNNRFACFVVGDARDAQGFYYGFPGHTIDAFVAAGLRLYNEAILVTSAGSLPIRAGKQFQSTRKLGKTHQNFYTFVKGDPRKATEAIGEVEIGDPAAFAGEGVEELL